MDVKPFTLIILLFLPFISGAADGAEIKGPDVSEPSLMDGSIVVSTGLSLDEKETSEIEKGISREIVFYVDLFRAWSFWPDEFVLGKRFTRTIKCDPVKKEYTATSLSGVETTEQRFEGCAPLLEWALNISGLRLTSTATLEPVAHFVTVTAESRLRRLPPVISSILFFVRETEFSISRSSPLFNPKGGGGGRH